MPNPFKNKIKVILFDYDDTLVKTRESKWDAIKETAKRHYDLEIDSDHIAKYWGLPFEEMLTGALNNADSFEKLRDNYYSVTTEFPMEAHKGAVEFFDKLPAEYQVGIVTASNKKLVIDDLTRLNFPIGRFFEIQTAEDTDVHKPDPKVFVPILEKLGNKSSKQNILYVGDGLKDFYSAKGAGLAFLGITHGTTSKAEFENEGASVVSSFDEILDLI